MNSGEAQVVREANASSEASISMRLEVVVLPVSDIDRAKRFYADLGWRVDIDTARGKDFRLIQFTPPGSDCSVIFGKNITTAAPGSVQGLLLVVPDLETARKQLLRRGVAISEPFHDSGGIFHRVGAEGHVWGFNPRRKSYASYAAFSDPDGNGWVLQEVTARLTGDLPPGETDFTDELADAVREAVAAQPGSQDAKVVAPAV
jgi:catechol 2,3-dioxygenase-like lactoylglutathione lyase family enzyme